MNLHVSIPEKILHKENIRILITRTDRLGDLLLSTPVFSAIRKRYPHAYIAVMVLPYTVQLLEHNPDIDRLIVYDKRGMHKHWWQHFSLIAQLRAMKFDCAIHLHPTNRVHWISFLSNIPIRIGYKWKSHRFLSHKSEYQRHMDARHQSVRNFDLLSFFSIVCPEQVRLSFYVTQKDEDMFDEMLKEKGCEIPDRSFIINPVASCPSKMWPAEKFAQLIDQISAQYGLTAVLVGGKSVETATVCVKKHLTVPIIDLSEACLSFRLLSVLFSRTRFFISNDTGMVHLASALDFPVISIFGRSGLGLSPQRWEPLGEKSFYVHKPNNCVPCKAHDCTLGFKCLHNIDIDDIIRLLDENREMFRLKE